MKKLSNKIYIQHLAYTVLIKEPNKDSKFVAYVHKDNKNQCTLFIKRPVNRIEAPTLAHEIVHILQYICEARNIDMIFEQEHMGYLMNFIMNEVMGLTYE